MRVAKLIVTGCAVGALACAPTALASTSPGSGGSSGGANFTPGPGPQSTPQHPVVKGYVAKVIHGLAYAPSYAPIQVQRAIWAGDQIRHKSYCYGGGHGEWSGSCYDCSGSVSFVLHAAGLLKTSMDSSGFMGWGQQGEGAWITIYTNPGHAFIQIAGIRLDTSAAQDPDPPPGSGPRWRPLVASAAGFIARHPVGF